MSVVIGPRRASVAQRPADAPKAPVARTEPARAATVDAAPVAGVERVKQGITKDPRVKQGYYDEHQQMEFSSVHSAVKLIGPRRASQPAPARVVVQETAREAERSWADVEATTDEQDAAKVRVGLLEME